MGTAAYNKAWYEKNKTRLNLMRKARYQANKEVELAQNRAYNLANKEARKAQAHAWHAKNKDAINARKRARYDRERHRIRQLAYRRRNPDKVHERTARYRAWKKQALVLERINRLAIYARDRGLCHICGKRVPIAAITLDHLIPLSRGGAHSAANVALAHRSCNARRGAGRIAAQLRLFG